MTTMMNDSMIPRPEYPRPSWRRPVWQCLNGWWDFAAAPAQFAPAEVPFSRRILVPFAPEAVLSGIGETDFMETVWYRRRIQVPREWRGERLLIHFQAVDYLATVWVDGAEVVRHCGCFTPFTADLPLRPGAEHEIIVRAQTLRDRNRPRGKQSNRRENYACCYTRTSGIWQSVWLEPVGAWRMKRPRVTPTEAGFRIEVPVTANRPGGVLHATLLSPDGEAIAEADARADATLTPALDLSIPKAARRPWSPEDPALYGLRFQLKAADGTVADAAESYAGWRFLTINGTRLLLNGRPVFQRLVLDQGYYPDGIWTAPSDAALEQDIRLAQQAGFNGARLHQKVFEERFLYHADRLGYLVWGEFGDWGWDWNTEGEPSPSLHQPGLSMVGQWLEALARDYSHPAIVGWCGLNETHRRAVGDEYTLALLDELTKAMFLAAKAADRTRPVLDVSGYIHRIPESDIHDIHDYGQPDEVAARLAALQPPCLTDPYGERPWGVPWTGQPFFLSEIGGIGWPVREGDFSYGPAPRSADEVLDRIGRLLAVIRADPRVFGYCYTQLTDIYQERNGLYTFDRKPKFDLERLRALQTPPSAYTMPTQEVK